MYCVVCVLDCRSTIKIFKGTKELEKFMVKFQPDENNWIDAVIKGRLLVQSVDCDAPKYLESPIPWSKYFVGEF